MNPLNKRIWFVVFAFLCVVASALVYSSFIKPTYQTVVDLRSELITKQEWYQKYITSSKQLSAIVAAGQDATRVQDIARQVLPPRLDISQVLAQINGFARLNRVSATSFATQVEQTRPPIQSVLKSIGVAQTTASIQGGYTDIKTMLSQLEVNILILDAERIRIARVVKDGVEQPRLEGSVSIISYYQAE
jgi:Tfp pilus assembly protein PilO